MPKKINKSPWIIIPIETKVREFDAKLLLACYASEAGFGVILGKKSIINKLAKKYLPTGIYIGKAIASRDKKLREIMDLKNRGYKLVCLDEEGLLRNEFFYNFRISPETLNNTDLYFVWGNEQAESVIQQFPEEKNKIEITGNPRIDLWRAEFRNLYKKDSLCLKEKYGPYILIVSNFSRANHYYGADYPLKQAKSYGALLNYSDEKSYKESIEHKTNLFDSFVNSIDSLSEAFPDYNIIIRPHPTENHDTWKNAATDKHNVKVIFEGQITPWIMGSELVIHNSCTSGVESNILDVPVISYQPYVSDRYDFYLPNTLSRQVYDENSLIKAIEEILSDRNNYQKPVKSFETAKYYIANATGPYASERIVETLKRLEVAPQSFKTSYIQLSEGRKPSIKKIIKKIISKSMTLASLNERGNKSNNKIVSRSKTISSSDFKFPGLTLEEVQSSIDLLSDISGRFNSVEVLQISEDCFCIISQE